MPHPMPPEIDTGTNNPITPAMNKIAPAPKSQSATIHLYELPGSLLLIVDAETINHSIEVLNAM